MDEEPFAAGREFNGVRRRLSRERILALSGGALGSVDWPRKNLHTDAGKAAEAGLPAPIASGIQCEGDIVRLLITLFGESWFYAGRLNVTHRRPVFEGTLLQARARVEEVIAEREGDMVRLEVWCETPEREIVTAGVATCMRRRRP